MLSGACLEQIGNETAHPRAPRKNNSSYRDLTVMDNFTRDHPHFLSNAGDFRKVGGTQQYRLNKRAAVAAAASHDQEYSFYTSFHFHNFFSKPNSLRFKYFSYGHPNRMAYSKNLGEIHPDLAMMVSCVKDEDVSKKNPPPKRVRVPGGFDAVPRFTPIYFQDPVYRQATRLYS